VGLHAEVIQVALLGLVYFRVALAVLVLDLIRRIDQCGIEDGALVHRQASITQIAIDLDLDANSQVVFFQQSTEVKDAGFVRKSVRAHPVNWRRMVVSYGAFSISGSL
jgi:hypothetical protein